MSVYYRFKKNPSGFRQLIELLETTPLSRRENMLKVGMEEDPEYTEAALKYVFTFDDILHFSDMELAELLSVAPPRTAAYALLGVDEETKQKFIRNCKPPQAAEIKDFMLAKITNREAGGAQLKMIEYARGLEKKGYIKTKRIPM
jgi:flagellar motor switch protein FliG